MNPVARRWLPYGAMLVALCALIALGWYHRGRFSPAAGGARAPGFTLETLDGRSVSLGQYRGKVVLLNVWATWCSPCVWEMPSMERLYRELAPRGLEVVAVSVDAVGPGAGRTGLRFIEQFVEDLGITFTVLHDGGGEMRRAYGVSGLPTTYLIDRNGMIVHTRLGPAEWDDEPHRAMVLDLLEPRG
jgi:cytochrome c biogenesis protein CcmG, thiol:disulfide interchange protein DsbE